MNVSQLRDVNAVLEVFPAEAAGDGDFTRPKERYDCSATPTASGSGGSNGKCGAETKRMPVEMC